MIIFPILALGLTVVGTLSVKIAAARRARAIIDHPEPDAVHDKRQEWRDDQDQCVYVDERREYHSLIAAISDYSPFRAEGGAYQITHEIGKRRDKLRRRSLRPHPCSVAATARHGNGRRRLGKTPATKWSTL